MHCLLGRDHCRRQTHRNYVSHISSNGFTVSVLSAELHSLNLSPIAWNLSGAWCWYYILARSKYLLCWPPFKLWLQIEVAAVVSYFEVSHIKPLKWMAVTESQTMDKDIQTSWETKVVVNLSVVDSEWEALVCLTNVYRCVWLFVLHMSIASCNL